MGTTVAPPRMGVAVGSEQHTWPGAADDAWKPTDCTLAVAPATVADLLETDRDENVHTVRRSRVSHGQPVAAELIYTPSPRCPTSPR